MGGKNRRGRETRSSSSSSYSSSSSWRSSSSSNSLFSMMNIFKLPLARKPRNRDADVGGQQQLEQGLRRARASDEDRGRYFAEPDIDRKASDFIAKFYEARVMDPERQFHQLPAPVNNAVAS